jgi:nucleoside-diphosphate-sugar epimerase
MPVIVIGADHPLGEAIVSRLASPDREVRAFVSSPAAATGLRVRGIKVALGDLSDEGHVAAACTNCFSAVLVIAATTDGRELGFAASAPEVLDGWVRAVSEAGVRRVIWVGPHHPAAGAREEATVDHQDPEQVASSVARLDDAARL